MKKKIKGMGKICTFERCKWKSKFPYCAEGCSFSKFLVEYEDE